MTQTERVDSGDPEPRESFDQVPDIYHSIRPGYPPACSTTSSACCHARPRVLEVGPGTGQAVPAICWAVAHPCTPSRSDLLWPTKLRQVMPSKDLAVTVGNFEQVPAEEKTFDCVLLGDRLSLDRTGGAGRSPCAVSQGRWHRRDRRPRFRLTRRPIRDSSRRRSPSTTGMAKAMSARRRLAGKMSTRRCDDVNTTIASRGRVRRYDWDQTYSGAVPTTDAVVLGTQVMEPRARRGLLDDMEAFVKEHFDDRVTRPLVVALTTATRLA